MIGGVFALALAGSAAAALDPRATIDLQGTAIHVGDVVPHVSGRVAGVEIARLPVDRASISLSRRALAGLVRRAVPSLALADGPGITFRRVSRRVPTPVCFVAREAIAAGETIGADRVVPGHCASGATAVRYVRGTGAMTATARIAAGEAIGGALPNGAPVLARGDALTLTARSGAVTIERPVVALQPARSGGRVFVRASDGQVFAAAIARSGS